MVSIRNSMEHPNLLHLKSNNPEQVFFESIRMENGFTEYVNIAEIEIFETGNSKVLYNFAEIRALLERGKLRSVKKLLRTNSWQINSIVRRQLWPTLCIQQRSKRYTLKGVYWQIVDEIYGTREIPEDPLRLPAYVDKSCCCSYNLYPKYSTIITRITQVLAYDFPGITYSPLVYPITALLLHYISEEETYQCMTLLITTQKRIYFQQTKLMHQRTSITLWLMTRCYAQNVLNYLRNMFPEVKLERWFNNWYWWLFTGLPFEYLVRIMDCYLFDGVKVLYRVTIVILKLFSQKWHKNIKLSKHIINTNVDNALKLFCEQLPVPPAKLLKAAFSIRRLSTNYIDTTFKKTDHFAQSESKPLEIHELPLQQQQLQHKEVTPTQFNFTKPWHYLLYTLWTWIPQRIAIRKPKRLFSLQEDGCSLQTFYKRLERHEPTLFLIRTCNTEIFGAYCSTSWHHRQDGYYFGTGETFLFTLHPKCMVYPWVGKNGSISNSKCVTEWFVAADNRRITIGGGEGEGIWIDQNMHFGKTSRCTTFNNAPLCESGEFEVYGLEVYAFVDE